MAINLEIPYGVKITNPAAADYYYGPWANRDEALAKCPMSIRTYGLKVFLLDTKTVLIWKSGLEDEDLISDIPAVTIGDIPDTMSFLAINWDTDVEPISGITYASKHGSLKSVVIHFMTPSPLNASAFNPSLNYNIDLFLNVLTLNNESQNAFYVIK